MAFGEFIRAAIFIVAGIELWMVIDLLITIRKQKKKLAKKDQDIHKLEFTLDEKQDTVDVLNKQIKNLTDNKENPDRKVSLYDCASLFAESMSDKFRSVSNDSAIFLITSDGNKVSSIINGDDDLLRNMVAFVVARDEETRSIVGDGFVAALQHLQETDNKENT